MYKLWHQVLQLLKQQGHYVYMCAHTYTYIHAHSGWLTTGEWTDKCKLLVQWLFLNWNNWRVLLKVWNWTLTLGASFNINNASLIARFLGCCPLVIIVVFSHKISLVILLLCDSLKWFLIEKLYECACSLFSICSN